jgi:hypothetical protein
MHCLSNSLDIMNRAQDIRSMRARDQHRLRREEVFEVGCFEFWVNLGFREPPFYGQLLMRGEGYPGGNVGLVINFTEN